MGDDIAEKVIQLYHKIDEETTALQAATGLQCSSGCGRCCENPEIEATPLEMLPLAMELFRRGEALQWLERVAGVKETDNCVFYRPDPLIAGNGRCDVYSWRPTVCRLFGFATVKNKRGLPELVSCACHKQTMPEVVLSAQEAIAAGLPSASFSDFAIQLANLDPYLGQERMPIEKALQVAISRMGLMAQLAGEMLFNNSD